MWNVGPPAFATMTAATLTAQLKFDLEWIILAVVLGGLVLLGGFVIVRYKRWHAEQQAAPPPMVIEDYRALMEQGVLDPREFERIREHLERNPPPPSTSR